MVINVTAYGRGGHFRKTFGCEPDVCKNQPPRVAATNSKYPVWNNADPAVKRNGGQISRPRVCIDNGEWDTTGQCETVNTTTKSYNNIVRWLL